MSTWGHGMVTHGGGPRDMNEARRGARQLSLGGALEGHIAAYREQLIKDSLLELSRIVGWLYVSEAWYVYRHTDDSHS